MSIKDKPSLAVLLVQMIILSDKLKDPRVDKFLISEELEHMTLPEVRGAWMMMMYIANNSGEKK